jgi:hypothetical protein
MNANGRFHRGEIVWGIDPFKDSAEAEPEPERPFLVLSNETHPFAEQQFAGVALSTTPRDEAVAIDPNDWTAGGLPRQSYAYSWLLVTRDRVDVSSVYGRLRSATVDTVLDRLVGYLSARDSHGTDS